MRLDRPKKLHTTEDALTINMRSFSVYRALSASVKNGFVYRTVSIGLVVAVLAPSIVPVVVYADEIELIETASTTTEEVVEESEGEVEEERIEEVEETTEEAFEQEALEEEGDMPEDVEEDGFSENDVATTSEDAVQNEDEEVFLLEVEDEENSSVLNEENTEDSATNTPVVATPSASSTTSVTSATSTNETEESVATSTPSTSDEVHASSTESVLDDEEVSTSTTEIVDTDSSTTTATTTSDVIPQAEEEIFVDPADLLPPEIIIIGNNPAFVSVGSVYADQGVLVDDNKSNNLGHTIRVNGIEVDVVDLDTSTTSEHAITYVAKDQDGNVSVAVRTVFVGSTFEEYEESESVATTTATTTANDTASASLSSSGSETEIIYIERESAEYNALNKHTFSESECVVVAEGEYYCVATEGESASSTPTHSNKVGAFVAKANGEDKEIFFNNGETVVQITDNEYEDDRPVYDDISGIIAWQSLRDDRFQIFTYNTITGVETQITNAGYNNTNPSLDLNTVVWQGWVNNNWEIFLSDADIPTDETIRPITTNVWNDMFPQIKNGVVTWQSRINDSWRVFVYNNTTGETSEVAIPAGGKIENPRFVILVENRMENGDVETYGYDVVTKETFPLGAKSNKEQEIPEHPAQEQQTTLPPTQEVRSPKDDDTDSGDE
ncbi:MAG: immunoglobulin-like domain-containing protein [Candidatus Paceibacterota bacterium]